MSEEKQLGDTAKATPENTTIAPSEKPKSNALILIIGIVVLLLGGAGVFLFLTPMGKKLIGKHDDHGEVVAPKDLVFFPMPELLVNLATTQKVKKPPFLRLVLKLELSAPDEVKTMELVKPRVIDQFQVFLRELRAEDLQGSSGLQRLREELLKRANSVSAPIKVKDVLFEVMLIQ